MAQEMIAKADCKEAGEYAELYRINVNSYRLLLVERRLGRKDNILDTWDGSLTSLSKRFERLTGRTV